MCIATTEILQAHKEHLRDVRDQTDHREVFLGDAGVDGDEPARLDQLPEIAGDEEVGDPVAELRLVDDTTQAIDVATVLTQHRLGKLRHDVGGQTDDAYELSQIRNHTLLIAHDTVLCCWPFPFPSP